MAESNFWDHPESAQKVITEAAGIKNAITPLLRYQKDFGDLQALFDLIAETKEEDPDLFDELETSLKKLTLEIAP